MLMTILPLFVSASKPIPPKGAALELRSPTSRIRSSKSETRAARGKVEFVIPAGFVPAEGGEPALRVVGTRCKAAPWCINPNTEKLVGNSRSREWKTRQTRIPIGYERMGCTTRWAPAARPRSGRAPGFAGIGVRVAAGRRNEHPQAEDSSFSMLSTWVRWSGT
jgi:hypothetical protein